MDAFDVIRTKLDIREFSSKPVAGEIRAKVLEAALGNSLPREAREPPGSLGK
ncbi:MAG: hypothetical protein JRN28_01110 [Nitrososphaerota archaeon]|nr:hypothetical protein [Nitrososphaerota archaeon]